ncbi:hypothetical protein JRO89_XS06G0137200 [Xanthoceras sorbifolium]|uniref:Protein FLX-like 4 n=1 Tax=Xanthoceras sorbifolium TaxID=99658 RepID=A0ABQ8HY46_9ROSI|nr:hypothetical protein JRO89_XS06G0137200 [Xanthoceras sorbifolium]
MSSRRKISPLSAGHTVQAPGMLRHGPPPGLPAGHRLLEPRPHPGLLEDKIAVQAAEIERLAGENHRLAATHGSLREELVASQQEIPRLRAHIRSMHVESDIQIRVLLDKIAKMEANIRAGERIKKDLQQAHVEAQSLVKARQELIVKIQQASQELHKVRLEVKSLPALHTELESLKQEYQRLRATFEYEKGLNIGKVEQLQAMEKDLFGMAREIEKLRAEVQNAEMRAHAPSPYTSGYMNPNPLYPPPVQGGGVFVDGYGKPVVQMGVVPAGEGMFTYGSANGVPDAVAVSGAPVPGPVGGAVWSRPYDPSVAPR